MNRPQEPNGGTESGVRMLVCPAVRTGIALDDYESLYIAVDGDRI